MNIVVLCGELRSAPLARPLPDGTVVWSFDLAAEHPVPVVWSAGAAPPPWRVGDALVVAGAVRRRFFRTGGATQSRTEVVADAVLRITPRRPQDRALAHALATLGGDEAARLRSQIPDREEGGA